MKNLTKKFLNLPGYPGGKQSYINYIKENLHYPEEAREKRIQGIVYIEAVINDNGEVLKVIVIKGIGAGCDEEAIRLIQNIRFERVKNRGVRIKTKKKFRIEFKLPPQKELNYEIVEGKNKNSQPASTKTYSYSIRKD